MNTFLKLLFLISLLVLTKQVYAQNTKLDSNEVILKIEKNLCEKCLGKYDNKSLIKDSLGRYMEGTLLETTKIEGWGNEELPIYKYTSDDKINGQLTAKVIMYNADILRIANWIYYALDDSEKEKSDENIQTIISYIKNTSGFQFPIRGVVYEDIYDKNCNCQSYDDCKEKHLCKDCSPDKIQESYIFFDGLTVKHKDINQPSQDITLTICQYDIAPIRVTEKQNERLLNMTTKNIKWIGNYARIASTNVSTFKNFMAKVYPQELQSLNLSSSFTPEIVRKEYIQAMNSKRNNLISAWVYSSPEVKK